MNKRRIVLEITIEEVPSMPNDPVMRTSNRAQQLMQAVFVGIATAKLPYEARVILLEDKAVFEGTVPSS